MHGPTGLAGVQALAKSGQSLGCILPFSTSPHLQPAMGLASGSVSPRRAMASNCANSGRNTSPLPGMQPMPRHRASAGSKTSCMTDTALGLPASDTTRV